MPSEAGVFTARGIHELHMMVSSLAGEDFRIITVLDTQNGDYHVVAQKEPALTEKEKARLALIEAQKNG